MFSITIASVVLVQFVVRISAASGDDVIIEIDNGQIRGQESATFANTTYYYFAGIPFAQPPIGQLRFEPPLPAKNWTGILNATKAGNDCTKSVNNTVVGSEDCLFVNVYTTQLPSNTTAHPKLPVIVWIHGGGFILGNGNLGLHGADRFLNTGVIIVSLNYRLGIFGFLSTMDDVIPGNYGLKDQILALRWVQSNVVHFGGDPNNVTIMGESAGAALVHYLIQSQAAKGLFQKAISESGSSLNPWSQAKCPRQLAFRVGLLNGVWTVSSTTLKRGLRKINSANLQRSTTLPALLDLYDPLNGLPFAPVIELPSAEAVVTGYCYSTLSTGNFSRVPLLLGFNSLEAREAQNLPWYGFLLLEQYNLFPSRLTPDDMHANTKGNSQAGAKIKKYYFNNQAVRADANAVYYVTDDEFVRGIAKTARLQSRFGPTYLYRFAFTGGVTHKSFQPEGVSHAEELQFLWLSNTTIQKTPAARLTVARLIQLWTNFAKTGNPTPYLNEIVNVTWPVVNATGGQDVHYLNIDTVLEAKVNPNQGAMAFWDTLYADYGNAPYNTY